MGRAKHALEGDGVTETRDDRVAAANVGDKVLAAK
jgi:hypothetical protein